MFCAQKKALGQVVFDQVLRKLEILERDYFGLLLREGNNRPIVRKSESLLFISLFPLGYLSCTIGVTLASSTCIGCEAGIKRSDEFSLFCMLMWSWQFGALMGVISCQVHRARAMRGGALCNSWRVVNSRPVALTDWKRIPFVSVTCTCDFILTCGI